MRLFVRDKAFYRDMLRIALPVSLQSVLAVGLNVTDTIMLGSMGEIPIAASSLANQYDHIFHVLCLGMGGGAAVMTARQWGQRDTKAMRGTMALMMRICVMLGAAFTFAATVFPASIMRIYTPNTLVIQEGVRYFSFLGWTFVLNGLVVTLPIVLRSAGKVRAPLLMAVAAFGINIFMNWVFIFGNLGAPRMGIVGAALATLLSRAVEAGILLIYLFREKDIGFRFGDLFAKAEGLRSVFFRFSVPVVVSDLFLALGDSMLTMIMGRISPEFVAASAITMVVMRVSSVLCIGMSSASGVLTGNTLGRKDAQAAYNNGVTFMVLNVLVGAVMGVLVVAARPLILSAYNITASTWAIAMQLMLAIGIMFPCRTLATVLTKGILRSGGDTRFLMLADIFFLWVASVPLGYLCALVWGLPPLIIYIAFTIEFPLKALLCLWRFHSRKWIKEMV